jgi:hypothetical protein
MKSALKRTALLLAILIRVCDADANLGEAPLTVIQAKVADFANYFPTYVRTNTSHLVTNSADKVPTMFKTKEFSLERLTNDKLPYDDRKAEILVFQNGGCIAHVECRGFMRIDASWVDEDVLKIELWPSATLQLVELRQVLTGQIVYRAARQYLTLFYSEPHP